MYCTQKVVVEIGVTWYQKCPCVYRGGCNIGKDAKEVAKTAANLLSPYKNSVLTIDFNHITPQSAKQIQYKTNSRPREKLNFDSPKNKFFKFCV